jgi:PEP-CTERM motif
MKWLNLKWALPVTALLLFGASQASAQCPGVGADTNGCELVITVTAVNGTGVATAFTVATSTPDQGPYDAVEDTLVGVKNSSGAALTSIALSSPVDAFAFDGDGPCVSTGLGPTPANCSSDPSGYGGPGVTFSGINAATTSGTVNFGPSVANGGTAWFGLEEAVTASQITGGGGGTTSTPEPGSFMLLASGLLGLVGFARRKALV